MDFARQEVACILYLQFLKEPQHHTSRGGGYWFWKPVLWHYHMQKLNHGDFLVYSDNDMTAHLESIPNLLQQMMDRQHNLALHQPNHSDRNERHYNKREVYKAYCPGLDQAQDTSRQYDAMFAVIRKDDATIQAV